jgi:hypothetical protein
MQAFDITAQIDEISARRCIKERRCVRDVFLVDGSTTEANSGESPPAASESHLPTDDNALIRLKVTVWYDATAQGDDPDFIAQLLKSTGTAQPFHFLGLAAQSKNGQYRIETMRSWYHIAAAMGSRAQMLEEKHAELLCRKQQSKMKTLQTAYSGADNDEELNKVPGQETFCCHISDMSKKTGITAIDDGPTVWQINWVFATLDPQQMLTEAGDRLWLRLVLSDLTGQASVQMGEKIALALSGRDSKDEFTKAVSDGDPVFPTMLSVKIARRMKSMQNNEGSGSIQFISNIVIDACPQDTAVPRTQTSITLINVLRCSARMSGAILPASLSMMMPSKLYPLLIKYPDADLQPQPCSRVWVVIKATKKSTCTDEAPYQVTTTGITDALHSLDGSAASDSTAASDEVKYTMTSMCNKENRTSLMLTPSHGKHVFALAVITACQDGTLFAENVEQLQASEKDRLLSTMRQEMTLVVKLMQSMESNQATPWSDSASPLVSQKCRALGRSPTGPPVDAMEVSVAKKPRQS